MSTEKAARKLCELRGVDPDAMVPHGHPEGYAVLLHSPAWELAEKEITYRLLLDEAMKFCTAENES